MDIKFLRCASGGLKDTNSKAIALDVDALPATLSAALTYTKTDYYATPPATTTCSLTWTGKSFTWFGSARNTSGSIFAPYGAYVNITLQLQIVSSVLVWHTNLHVWAINYGGSLLQTTYHDERINFDLSAPSPAHTFSNFSNFDSNPDYYIKVDSIILSL